MFNKRTAGQDYVVTINISNRVVEQSTSFRLSVGFWGILNRGDMNSLVLIVILVILLTSSCEGTKLNSQG